MVLAAIKAADYVAHAKIIAFDWNVLRLARRRIPTLATAHLTIPAVLATRVKLSEDGLSPWNDGFDPVRLNGSAFAAIAAHGGSEWSPNFSEVTPERVADADGYGLRVGPWGLSTAGDLARMRELGVASSTVSGSDWT